MTKATLCTLLLILSKGAKKHFEELGLQRVGKNYFTLGIIGAQSSGKSTLLNHCFGTDFAVLDSTKFRKQTTKGIWVARDPHSNLLVLDIEGSDSRERWEGKTVGMYDTAIREDYSPFRLNIEQCSHHQCLDTRYWKILCKQHGNYQDHLWNQPSILQPRIS